MAFSHEAFVRLRPFLFHLTHRNNIDVIAQVRTLHCAATVMREAGDVAFLRRKRDVSMNFQSGARLINLRDQQPLYAGNIRLQGGWSFQDVIQSLNERVFFWPGTSGGPINHGHRHYERYAHESPIIVRVSTAELYAANPGSDPLFCRYNSGSPRCSNGRGSPRGPNTFLSAGEVDFTPSRRQTKSAAAAALRKNHKCCSLSALIKKLDEFSPMQNMTHQHPYESFFWRRRNRNSNGQPVHAISR
jgi:Family of unknown function (DUF7002)